MLFLHLKKHSHQVLSLAPLHSTNLHQFHLNTYRSLQPSHMCPNSAWTISQPLHNLINHPNHYLILPSILRHFFLNTHDLPSLDPQLRQTHHSATRLTLLSALYCEMILSKFSEIVPKWRPALSFDITGSGHLLYNSSLLYVRRLRSDNEYQLDRMAAARAFGVMLSGYRRSGEFHANLRSLRSVFREKWRNELRRTNLSSLKSSRWVFHQFSWVRESERDGNG